MPRQLSAHGAVARVVVRVLPALALLSAITLMVGCGASTQTESVATQAAPPLRVPAAAGHVHALAATREGVLVGTHGGLFALSTRGMTRVGNGDDDVMGLARSQDGRVWSSGHPGPSSTAPNPLGLRVSTNGGRTWRSVRGAGSEDFHLIATAGVRMYALVHEANRLLTGPLGGPFTQRTAPAPELWSLAAHPTDPDRLIGANAEGLFASTDGARSWQALPGTAGYLAWPTPTALYRVDELGAVSVSADGGRSWQARGEVPGLPVALAATDARSLLVADGDGRVYRSTDGARSWR